MIGQLNVSGEPATLSDDGIWSCADTVLAAYLNRHFNPRDEGPAAGIYGRGCVVRAALALRAEPWLAPEPEPEPDEFGASVVY
jgi:hypothetical protein